VSTPEKLRQAQEAVYIEDALKNGAISAEDLKLSVVGQRIGGRFYASKNKTARMQPYREHYVREIHMYSNGNIMFNGGVYLKVNTPVWVMGA